MTEGLNRNDKFKYWGIESQSDEKDSLNARSRLLSLVEVLFSEGKKDSIIMGSLAASLGFFYGEQILDHPHLKDALLKDIVDCVTYHATESQDTIKESREEGKSFKRENKI